MFVAVELVVAFGVGVDFLAVFSSFALAFAPFLDSVEGDYS
jgi:hypothetical protein